MIDTINLPLTDWGEDAHADTDRTTSRVSSKQQKSQRASRASNYLDAAALPQKRESSRQIHLAPTRARGHRRQRPGARDRPVPWRPAGARRRSVAASDTLCRAATASNVRRTGSGRSRDALPAPVGASRQRAATARYGMACHAFAWHRGTRGALLKAKRSDPASGSVARRSLPAREL